MKENGGDLLFKSVFAKYVCAFVLIILLSFAMLSALISAMISSFADEEKEEEVTWIAENTAKISRVGIFGLGNENDIGDLTEEQCESLSRMIGFFGNRREEMVVFITDATGKVLLSSDTETIKTDGVLPADIFLKINEEGKYREAGVMQGLLPVRSVVVAYAIRNDAGKLIGTAVAAASTATENALIGVLEKTVLLSSLWVMLAAMIAAYFISDYMVSPLKTMVSASKKFAKGEFDARVPAMKGRNEISELAIAFNDMAESLGTMEKTRNTFLCNVAHDLRTPMTTISGFIDGILDGAVPPEKEEYYLRLISGEIHRLSRLVSQILEISRYEPGNRKFVFSEFDIAEMARIILISFEQKIDAKKLEVDFEAEEENMFVSADKDAIYQVFYNLCDNAIKFSENGGDFRIKIASVDDKRLSVTVYNTGAGIPERDQPFVFDRFYKSDESRGRDKSGFGIGLFIVKSIIEGHNEKITLDSKEGEYCRFSFTLKKANRPDK